MARVAMFSGSLNVMAMPRGFGRGFLPQVLRLDLSSLGRVDNYRSHSTDGGDGEIVPGGLFVACCDTSIMFDGIEESLDEIALRVECEVAGPFDLAG